MKRLIRCAVMLVLFSQAVTIFASDTPYHQTIDGVAIYIGVVPSELVRGHPSGHAEATMHGGAPAGENHLTVALYDAKRGSRITNAKVTARVRDKRGFVVQKTLETMFIADSLTFGNYFSLRGTGPYWIDLDIQLPGKSKAVMATFVWTRS